jgi:SHS2 domain-containing protein
VEAGGGASFEFVDAVTSDLAFRARGPTLAAAFGACAEAFLAATLEAPAELAQREERRVELAEPDLELLLLRFLNELVYLRDAEQLLLRARELRVSEAEAGGVPARLEAVLSGERIAPGRHRLLSDVKAATAHGLRVARSDGGWEACATFDV